VVEHFEVRYQDRRASVFFSPSFYLLTWSKFPQRSTSGVTTQFRRSGSVLASGMPFSLIDLLTRSRGSRLNICSTSRSKVQSNGFNVPQHRSSLNLQLQTVQSQRQFTLHWTRFTVRNIALVVCIRSVNLFHFPSSGAPFDRIFSLSSTYPLLSIRFYSCARTPTYTLYFSLVYLLPPPYLSRCVSL
jgi:hypothetical protein